MKYFGWLPYFRFSSTLFNSLALPKLLKFWKFLTSPNYYQPPQRIMCFFGLYEHYLPYLFLEGGQNKMCISARYTASWFEQISFLDPVFYVIVIVEQLLVSSSVVPSKPVNFEDLSVSAYFIHWWEKQKKGDILDYAVYHCAYTMQTWKVYFSLKIVHNFMQNPGSSLFVFVD